MVKIILPVSFVTFLFEYSGWLNKLDGILEPLMGLLHLPATAAFPLIVGLLTGIYGAIAAMSVLPFTVAQMTLMAIFLLIAHNLIQEGIIQNRSGFSALLATLVRLFAAVVTVWFLSWVFGPETATEMTTSVSNASPVLFFPAIRDWAIQMAWLGLKILAIIMAVMIFMELVRQYHIIDRIIRAVEPALSLLGLDRRVALLWMTAAMFGIAYGGAVIVAEVSERPLSPEILAPLHVSIGINHAMIEDPCLFLPFGIHPFWLWVPRIITAVAFTHILRLWLWGRRRARRLAVRL